jgi:DNA-binding transcriptional LysR family regulator
MEIHQLRYFLSIAQTGSFTAAAEACHVSQPSLSAQVAKLERELGGPLFERGRHGARMTQRGEIFRVRAAEALAQLETGRRELEELTGLRRGSVALGCLPTTGAYLLPQLLRAFLDEYPDVHVRLQEASSPQLGRALRNFEIEIAIMDEAGLGGGIASEPLFGEPLVVAVPPGHRFADRSTLTMRELDGESFILMKHGHGYRQIVMESLTRAGVTPRIVYESDEIETVQRLVEAGLGISIVPRMVCKEGGPPYISIEEPTPSRTLLLAFRDSGELSPPAFAMRRMAIEILRSR